MMKKQKKKWLGIRGEGGASLIEYTLLLAGITVIAIGAVDQLGASTDEELNNAAINIATGGIGEDGDDDVCIPGVTC